MSRSGEVYKVGCCGCEATIELPCVPPYRCPHCGTVLTFNWRPSEPALYEKEMLLVQAKQDVELTSNQHAEAEVS